MKTTLAALVLSFLSVGFLCAWDSEGHMIVADVAFRNLKPAAKNAITRLLRKHPDYNTWVATIPGDAAHSDDRLERAMMIAATWPDQIKSASGFTDDGETPPNTPAAGQNVGYADKFQHRYWHFKDIPFAVGGATGKPAPAINAEERIVLFIASLAQAPTDANLDKQSYDLVWLLHLMGDIHQPLHCTSRFLPGGNTGDQGGLHVKVTPIGKAPTALHFYWDDLPGTSNDASKAKSAAGLLTPAPASTVVDVPKWVKESEKLAEQKVYANPIKNGLGPFQLTPAYEGAAKTIANSQLALAGARLAKILNDTLH